MIPKLEPRGALPLCLLVFALLFDLSVTTDRLIFGLALSVTSRYTMANLLLPLGLIAYGWSRLPSALPACAGCRPAVIAVAGCVRRARPRPVRRVDGLWPAAGAATSGGDDHGQQNRGQLRPHPARPSEDCYEFALVGDAGLVGDLAAIREARSERLTMFSDGRTYHELGSSQTYAARSAWSHRRWPSAPDRNACLKR